MAFHRLNSIQHDLQKTGNEHAPQRITGFTCCICECVHEMYSGLLNYEVSFHGHQYTQIYLYSITVVTHVNWTLLSGPQKSRM